MARRDDDFVAFVDARSAALLRTARLLSAGDRHAAEDLVQTALERAYVAWPRIKRREAQEAYVRSIMTRAAIDRTRRRQRRGEVLTDEVPEPVVMPTGPEDRDAVWTPARRPLAAPARGAGAALLRRPVRGADRRGPRLQHRHGQGPRLPRRRADARARRRLRRLDRTSPMTSTPRSATASTPPSTTRPPRPPSPSPCSGGGRARRRRRYAAAGIAAAVAITAGACRCSSQTRRSRATVDGGRAACATDAGLAWARSLPAGPAPRSCPSSPGTRLRDGDAVVPLPDTVNRWLVPRRVDGGWVVVARHVQHEPRPSRPVARRRPAHRCRPISST